MGASVADQPAPWLAVRDEVGAVLDRIDASAFADLVAEFAGDEGRFFFTGQGRSGLSARMAAMRLMHLGRRVHVVGEATAPAVRTGDSLVVFSASGKTPVSLAFAQIARTEGARVIAVTGASDSPIAQTADVVFAVPVSGSAQLGGTLFEQTSLLVLDAVMLALAESIDGAAEQFGRLHTNLQ